MSQGAAIAMRFLIKSINEKSVSALVKEGRLRLLRQSSTLA